jgi:hypothetical protein
MLKLIKRFASIVFASVLWAVGAGAAIAAAPDHVGVTLEGCRNNGTIALPNGSGQFVCPDAAYTTGNLGKGWNELDLVPHRLTVDAGNAAPASQTYTLSVAVDNTKAGVPGYDVLSTLTKKSGSCSVSVGAQTTLTPGVGGTDTSLARLVTITQSKNTICIFDFYARLALGSHLYSGSSLHANALNETFGTAGIGARDVSIPVKEISPQELRKTMAASADSTVQWSLEKAANPASIKFGDVCAADFAPTKQVTFRVTWKKVATAAGGVTAITNIYAKNPASRTITVNVSDTIYKGTTQTQALETFSTPLAGVDVLANTEQLVLTHTANLPSTAGAVGDFLNDVATATYTDKATGITVPGATEARASAQIVQGVTNDSFASIGDSESMTGTGLKFSVAQPTIGGFLNGYVAGTQSVGPVDWGIAGETAGRSVDFVKTIYLDGRRETTGTISDTAYLVADNTAPTPPLGSPFDASASASATITSSATVQLTVSKTIPLLILKATERIDVTFTIERVGGGYGPVDTTLSFASGETSKSNVLSNLLPGEYKVSEKSSQLCDGNVCGGSNLVIQGSNTQSVNLTAGLDGIFQASECAGTAAFTNIPAAGNSTARVEKITDPLPAALSGDDLSWTFTLTGPGGPVTKTVTAGAGFGEFPLVLQEGAYTVTETTKTGWVQTDNPTTCSFTVDYPADFGRTFGCSFHNQKQGKVKVEKTASGASLVGTSYAFTFELRKGASLTQNGTVLDTQIANAANLGKFEFTPYLKPGDIYQLCEAVMPGWNTNLAGDGPLFVPGSMTTPTLPNPGVNNMTVCVNFTVNAGQTRTFSVDNSPPPGGRALTIGFWKNWASCTSSAAKKENTLDKTLAKAEPGGLIVSADAGAPPAIFGLVFSLVLHGSTATPNTAPDCLKAVRLLDKSRIDNAKKMAGDPAFNMAAQLVAAELNVVAGAGTNATITNVITQAVLLLGKYDFDGKTHLAISAADATLMNNYAKILDDYNNNR